MGRSKPYHPEEAQREVEAWVEESTGSADLSKRARAEFLAQRLAEAAQLSDEAAQDARRKVLTRLLEASGAGFSWPREGIDGVGGLGLVRRCPGWPASG